MSRPYLLILLLCLSCDFASNKRQSPKELKAEMKVTADYELFIPGEHNGLLILFPCFPCDAEHTRVEFDIDDLAAEAGVAVLRMNYNMRLWMSQEEKEELRLLLEEIVESHNLDASKVLIGGFSGGGNVTMLIGDYLMSSDSSLRPRGLFVVDAPIDLLALYGSALRTLDRNFSEPSIQEAKWIKDACEDRFGTGDSSMVHYEHASPYTYQTHSLTNLSNLEGVRVRLYSEPDTVWWQENRQAAREDINAFYLKGLADDLKHKYPGADVEYITTQNKGNRSNGERHPHSWSIVDKEELIDWMNN